MTDRTAAERKRRERQREKAEMIIVSFEIEEASHVKLLTESEYLEVEQSASRSAINEATRQLVKDLRATDLVLVR